MNKETQTQRFVKHAIVRKELGYGSSNFGLAYVVAFAFGYIGLGCILFALTMLRMWAINKQVKQFIKDSRGG